jgi:hypothetical protein
MGVNLKFKYSPLRVSVHLLRAGNDIEIWQDMNR